MQTIVATDGASKGNRVGARCGWACYFPNDESRSVSGMIESGSNNVGELFAIQKALELTQDEETTIYVDSMYAMKCSDGTWTPKWKSAGWKTAKGTPVKNIEIIQEIDNLMQNRTAPVKFIHVYGHQTDDSFPSRINRKADEMASIACGGNEVNEGNKMTEKDTKDSLEKRKMQLLKELGEIEMKLSNM